MSHKDKFSYVSRFVVSNEGTRIGESVAIFNDLLIIKKQEDYYAIPLKHVEQKNNEIHLKGVVQWDKAKTLAQEWKHVQNGHRNQ